MLQTFRETPTVLERPPHISIIEVVFPAKSTPIKFSPVQTTYVQGPNFHNLTNPFDKVSFKGPYYVGVGVGSWGRSLGE